MTNSKRQGTGRFGWCLDDLHEKCWEWIPHRGLRCTCNCHLTTKENGND